MRRVLGVLVLGAVALGGGPASAQAPPSAVAADAITARAFAVRFKSLSDAAELVSAVLSAQGTVTLQPRLKTLTVQDRAPVLDRVAALLQSFDTPPRNVEVTLSLFLGTDRREQEAGRNVPSDSLSRDVRGIAETLGDFTKWNAYEPLGKGAVTGSEGERVVVNLSADYRVRYEVDVVQDAAVKLKDFVLQRVTRDPGGAERVQDVYTAAVVLPVGRTLMLGAAQNPESKRALFLTLQARPR